jgi:hypothetical protein
MRSYRACQDTGIWAWDVETREWVLIVPWVLAMLGDNPMQSEIACHVGLMGRMFCRICNVIGRFSGNKGEDESEAAAENQSDSASSIGTDLDPDNEPHQTSSTRKKSGKGETMTEAVNRVTRFLQVRASFLMMLLGIHLEAKRWTAFDVPNAIP